MRVFVPPAPRPRVLTIRPRQPEMNREIVAAINQYAINTKRPAVRLLQAVSAWDHLVETHHEQLYWSRPSWKNRDYRRIWKSVAELGAPLNGLRKAFFTWVDQFLRPKERWIWAHLGLPTFQTLEHHAPLNTSQS